MKKLLGPQAQLMLLLDDTTVGHTPSIVGRKD